MKNILNIITLLLAIAIVVSAAGCAEKTQIAKNELYGASDQVTSVVATPAPTTVPVKGISPAATPIPSAAPAAIPESSVTPTNMESMGSTSSGDVDPASKVTDVVCGMEIDKNTAEFTSEYEGTTYYFCCADCKQKFDENPETYISSGNSGNENSDSPEQESPTMNDSNSSTVVDVVCKMEIDKSTAEFTSEYEGTTYYFCSANCKSKFDANPEKYINNLIKVPVATFVASPISGNSPLNVTFTDASTGTTTSWNWNFGDGNNSTEQNPSHIYYTEGNYTVNLMVTNTNGTNSTFAKINVLPSLLSTTNFNSNVTEGYAPLSVQFNDFSKNATAWRWDFGDGTNSTDENPVHIYSKVGKYNVTLRAMSTSGNNTTKKYNYITVYSPKATDVVCKMLINKSTAEFKSEYKGKTYYFCSADCKQKFDRNPVKYIN